MDHNAGGPNNEYSGPDAPEDLDPLSPSQCEEKPKLEASETRKSQSIAQHFEHPGPNPLFWKIGRLLREKAQKSGLHDWLMVVFTFVLTIVAIEQYLLVKENNKTSGEQIDKIIKAADRIEDAADSFSGSARRINDGVGDAVGKLNSQAEATNNVATAGSIQASAAANIAANSATQMELSQRPWIGPDIGQKTPFIMGDGTKPIGWLIWFKNSGTSPALHVRVHVAMYTIGLADGLNHFPELQNKFNNLSVDQPGEFFILNGLDLPNSGDSAKGRALYYQGVLKNDILTGRVLLGLGGKIAYSDQLGNNHVTTFCVLYIPPSDVLPEGWGSCPIQEMAS